MKNSHTLLKSLRQLHLYVGLFVSPAILFFAFTGAMQTFSLHETVRGSDYQPAHWVMVLAQVHKNQTTVLTKKPAPVAEKPKANKPVDAAAKMPDVAKAPVVSKREQHVPMKIFFLLVALSLFFSTFSGIYMAYKFVRNRVVVTTLLVAGAVVPLVLLAF